ncbi:hypothetical protein T484DRAFT_1918987 [Baffinella frigidus]|nr:hypothetical protein T484DRAFT_1918987 [Cryptophyta sp. CCMP2293]
MKNLSSKRVATASRGRPSRRPSTNKAPYNANIEFDIALLKELLAIITALPASTTTSPEEQQARRAAKVLKIQQLALLVKTLDVLPCVQVLAATLSVQSLAEYEEKRAFVELAGAA